MQTQKTRVEKSITRDINSKTLLSVTMLQENLSFSLCLPKKWWAFAILTLIAWRSTELWNAIAAVRALSIP